MRDSWGWGWIREYWMIYLIYRWHGLEGGSSPTPNSTGDAREDWEREATCRRKSGEGAGEGLKSFDSQNASHEKNHTSEKELNPTPPPPSKISYFHSLIGEKDMTSFKGWLGFREKTSALDCVNIQTASDEEKMREKIKEMIVLLKSVVFSPYRTCTCSLTTLVGVSGRSHRSWLPHPSGAYSLSPPAAQIQVYFFTYSRNYDHEQ